MRRLASLAVVLLLAACGTEDAPPTVSCPTAPPTAASAQGTLADSGTAKVTVSGAVEGDFEIELNGPEAPLATANFVSLARCGFYDGVKFHRVLAGFVIQAGDPGTREHDGDFAGIGTGGPGYGFEIEPPADQLGYDPYSVSMANDTAANGSQFFIALADLNGGLARTYTIFGTVTSGTDVVDAIAEVAVNDPRIGVPLTPVTIERIEIAPGAETSPSGG